jgi:hypothetical protein
MSIPRWLVITIAILFFPVTVIVLIVRSKWTPRTKGILTTAWIGFLLILSAAGNGASSSNTANFTSNATIAQHSPAPDVALSTSPSQEPSASQKPTPTPTPSPSPSPSPQATVAQAFVTFLNTPSAHRGANATALVKTTPNTYCTIEVDYKSGPSTAQGLAPKTSSANGAVSWTWVVGTRTTTGDWPVIVTCGDASGQTYVHVT